ncbi:MAG: type III pantothenate kinase [Candidatus Omnitrophota bacterium]
MLLAVDIGNTKIAFAVMRGEKIIRIFRMETFLDSKLLKNEAKEILLRISRTYPHPEGIVICSVVPDALKIIKAVCRKILMSELFIIGENLKVPIKNKYRKPRQVGQDRLVCAYAAMKLYGFPAIVIDSGTAVTFDVVNRKGEYEGGIIAPGIRLSAESLFEKTALLPRVSIRKPKTLIGKDTKGSILSGLFYGYSSLTKGMIQLLSCAIHPEPVVVMTGGYTQMIRQYIQKDIDVLDETLVFKGMKLAHDQRESQRRKIKLNNF